MEATNGASKDGVTQAGHGRSMAKFLAVRCQIAGMSYTSGPPGQSFNPDRFLAHKYLDYKTFSGNLG